MAITLFDSSYASMAGRPIESRLLARSIGLAELASPRRCSPPDAFAPSCTLLMMSRERMLRPAQAVALWGVGCVSAVFFGLLHSHEPRVQVTMLAAFAMLLAADVWLASPAICASIRRAASLQTGVVMVLWPLAGYLVYAVGAGNFAWWRFGIAAAYALVPVTLAATAGEQKPGVWQDYAAVVAIFVGDGWLRYVFASRVSSPAENNVFPLLFAVSVALAAFVLVRRMEGIGYSLGWSWAWMGYALLSFAAVVAIDVPLGTAIHFLRFDPGAAHWRALPAAFLGIFAFTAWPEEFLFRGLLQNLLRRSLRSENAGWVVASILFGLAHIVHGQFPNWRYVLLATVAGLFYGFTWRKTGSIFPAAIVHALVDASWHLLFRTL